MYKFCLFNYENCNDSSYGTERSFIFKLVATLDERFKMDSENARAHACVRIRHLFGYYMQYATELELRFSQHLNVLRNNCYESIIKFP